GPAGSLASRRDDGATSRFSSSLRALGAVLRAALATTGDTLGIERATNDVIAHTRQVLDTTAADQHHGVLLEVVTLAGDIADDLKAVGQAHLGDLPQGRVRLLRSGGVDTRAHPPLLRVGLHSRHLVARLLDLARLANELVDRRHAIAFPSALLLRNKRQHESSTKTAPAGVWWSG